MTVSVVTGLTLQAAALWITHVGLRGRWISHVGAILLAVAVAYHGLTEVMQWLWPDGRHSYRNLIGQAPLDEWLLMVSAVLLLYSIVYVAVIRGRSGNTDGVARDPAGYLRGVKIRWLLVAVAPLVMLTVSGSKGASFDPGGGDLNGTSYVAGGLVRQLLIPLAAVVAATIIVTKGQRWILPVLGSQAAIMALDGDRRSIIFGTIITLYVLALARFRIPRRTLAIAVATAVILVLSVSASRAILGRQQFYAGAGADTRSTALVSGGGALGSPEAWSEIRDETVDRLDGNTFGALINLQIATGIPSVGSETLLNTLRLNIPAFLLPGKNETALESRSEEVFLQRHFDLDLNEDFIPGLFGSIVSYYGKLGLVIGAVMLAFLMAMLDRIVHRKPSPTRLAFGTGLVLAVLLYEQGLPGLLTIGRSGVALAVVAWLVPRIYAARRRRSGANMTASTDGIR